MDLGRKILIFVRIGFAAPLIGCISNGVASDATIAPLSKLAGVRNVFYVSPGGSDANDGLSPTKAFRTLERAEFQLVTSGSGMVCMMPGTYSREDPLVIPAGAQSQSWADCGGAAAVLDGNGRALEAIRVQGENVTVTGLTIRNFVNNGIVVNNAVGATVSGNRIENIASSTWAQAAVLVMGRSAHATVSRNKISDTGYSGIEFVAQHDGNLSVARILGNKITRTCRTKDDCGAIYISGRTPTSAEAVIADNKIVDYGAAALTYSFGIYLDDGASHIGVLRNTIKGSGTNPIMIHGGSHNLIAYNTIELQLGHQAVLYLALQGPRKLHAPSNGFHGNLVQGSHGTRDVVKVIGQVGQPLKAWGNHFQ